MPEEIDIHSLWRIYDDHNKKTGITHAYGLVSVFGPHRAIRELKKRCENEIELTGKPLAGCALYVKYLYGLMDLCISSDAAHTTTLRSDLEDRMIMVGEDDIAKVIENAWASSKDGITLSSAAKYDAFDEFEDIITDKYGSVVRTGEFTDEELELSQTLALGLGRRKSRTPAVEPAPDETPEEPETEHINEPVNELMTRTDRSDEIKRRMKRA